jgi:hypothetical protein
MALVQGIHILAHGDKSEARRIAEDIQQNQRLLVGSNSTYGAGAYAFYADRLPASLQDWPQILFTVEETMIVDVCKRDGASLGFFRIPGTIGDYVPIQVLTFNNLI